MAINYQVICNDVLVWAKAYDGPKYHALLCDPPYHLASITKRFGKQDSAPAKYGKDGAFQRTSAGFMGKRWDSDIAFHPEVWAALGEHMYPGAFGMAFSGSRTFHRIAVAIEDAGFIIHPCIGWIYASGFPKGTRIDIQIDKAAGTEREIVGEKKLWGHNAGTGAGSFSKNQYEGTTGVVRYEPITVPATSSAQAWEGHRYGLQALKPALEPIIVFQKPYEGRPLDCIVKTGAGALWIDGGRINSVNLPSSTVAPGFASIMQTNLEQGYRPKDYYKEQKGYVYNPNSAGRWPANLILSHTPACHIVGEQKVKGYVINRFTDGAKPFGGGAGHDYETEDMGDETVPMWECVDGCAVKALAEQSGPLHSGDLLPSHHSGGKSQIGTFNIRDRSGEAHPTYGDSGYADRFFYQADWTYEIAERLESMNPFYYCAKAGRRERDAGLNGLPEQERRTMGHGLIGTSGDRSGKSGNDPTKPLPMGEAKVRNPHPTIKPIALAKYLATLLLPPAEYAPRRLLVPFAGSCSEGIGALLAGWEEITCIELGQEYADLGQARMTWWLERMLASGSTDPKKILKSGCPNVDRSIQIGNQDD